MNRSLFDSVKHKTLNFGIKIFSFTNNCSCLFGVKPLEHGKDHRFELVSVPSNLFTQIVMQCFQVRLPPGKPIQRWIYFRIDVGIKDDTVRKPFNRENQNKTSDNTSKMRVIWNQRKRQSNKRRRNVLRQHMYS